jgi:hypothetical protein
MKTIAAGSSMYVKILLPRHIDLEIRISEAGIPKNVVFKSRRCLAMLPNGSEDEIRVSERWTTAGTNEPESTNLSNLKLAGARLSSEINHKEYRG